MAIRFRCKSCSGLMSITSRKAGAMVQCPTCGAQTLVPMEDIFDAAVASAIQPSQPPVSSQPEPDAKNATIDFVVSAPAEFHVAENDALDQEETERETPALRLRKRARVDDDMDLTPMVDVTFQLLIFFMVTASFALQKSIEVPTPDPDKKGAAQQLQILEDIEGSSIRVVIDAGNSILIDDDPVGDPTRLADVLRDKMRKELKTELLITANSAALHRSVIAVIDAANEVGMQKIRMVSRQAKAE